MTIDISTSENGEAGEEPIRVRIEHDTHLRLQTVGVSVVDGREGNQEDLDLVDCDG